MIAELRFNLPEQSEEFHRAIEADRAWIALRDIDNLCRGIVKHGSVHKTPEELAEWIRSIIADSGDLL